ncbi:MAG TPA: EamA family transporter [Bryobacteraceae bacterium]|nr:EamA family transporter [Bryobacteraceae bacterium]
MKIWFLVVVQIITTAASDLLQSHEMKRVGAQSVSARGMAHMLHLLVERRWLLLSIVSLAISFFAFMALVQIAPLSFAVPASAASFIVETVLAKFWLKEKVGPTRIVGACLVLCGVVLLGQ